MVRPLPSLVLGSPGATLSSEWFLYINKSRSRSTLLQERRRFPATHGGSICPSSVSLSHRSTDEGSCPRNVGAMRIVHESRKITFRYVLHDSNLPAAPGYYFGQSGYVSRSTSASLIPCICICTVR